MPPNLVPHAILPYTAQMNITLPPYQRKWLEAEIAAGRTTLSRVAIVLAAPVMMASGEIAAGRFASLEEALAVAVSGLMEFGADDLAWAKPKVDQARASFAEGDVSAGEAYIQRLDDRIAKLQSS